MISLGRPSGARGRAALLYGALLVPPADDTCAALLAQTGPLTLRRQIDAALTTLWTLRVTGSAALGQTAWREAVTPGPVGFAAPGRAGGLAHVAAPGDKRTVPRHESPFPPHHRLALPAGRTCEAPFFDRHSLVLPGTLVLPNTSVTYFRGEEKGVTVTFVAET